MQRRSAWCTGRRAIDVGSAFSRVAVLPQRIAKGA